MMVIPNRGRVVAVIVALALAGGLLTLALLAKPTQAQAQTEHFDEWLTGSSVFTDGCSSEEIAIEYRTHFTGTTTYDADGGGHVHVRTHSIAEGVGLTSGDKLVYRDQQTEQTNARDFESDQLPQTYTMVLNIYLIRQGESDATEDDSVFHQVYSVAIDADGELTLHADQGRLECY